MAEPTSKLQELVEAVSSLSVLDRVRLIEQVTARLEEELTPKKPKRSLYGSWAGKVSVTDEDIEEARRELWSNFPREDIG